MNPMADPEPVFAEPWEAHAFALAVKLSEGGLFSWSEWSVALAEELAAATRRGEPDDGSRYYHHWLAALERLVAAKNLVASPSLLARKEEWAAAYRRTRHGSPVTLEAPPQPLPLPAPSLTLPREPGREGRGQSGDREEPA
jgi:nitrile hydratase accessory protein